MRCFLVRSALPTPSFRFVVAPLARLLVAVTCFNAVACGSPAEPTSDLSGQWRTGPIPSGGSISMTLAATGATVSGTGQSQSIGPNGIATGITVTGTGSGASFVLHLAYATGIVARYSGSMVGGDTLVGSYSIIGQPQSDLTLYRQ